MKLMSWDSDSFLQPALDLIQNFPHRLASIYHSVEQAFVLRLVHTRTQPQASVCNPGICGVRRDYGTWSKEGVCFSPQ